MSLAMYAAPFDDNQTGGDTDNAINRKRQTHNKTIKKYPKENFDQQKVNSVLIILEILILPQNPTPLVLLKPLVLLQKKCEP